MATLASSSSSVSDLDRRRESAGDDMVFFDSGFCLLQIGLIIGVKYGIRSRDLTRLPKLAQNTRDQSTRTENFNFVRMKHQTQQIGR